MDMKKIFSNASFISTGFFSTKNMSVLIAAILLVGSSFAHATPRDQAKRIHDRLTGIPPTATVLDSMAQKITAGDSNGAAMEAMESPGFYNTFLKNYITPWTNEAGTVFAPLNDYTATVIGIIRDNESFKTILTDDVVYIGAGALELTPYSHTDNVHYQQLENSGVNLGDPANLVKTTQSGLAGTQFNNADQAAGIHTSRAAGAAFFRAGTNRRMFTATSQNHLCLNIAELNDVSRTPDRVGRDVTRSPGGDSTIFLNSCVGCHAGMDPLVQAFAYYEWDPELGDSGRVVFTDGEVQEKYEINATTFPLGYIVEDDSWDSAYWRAGQNAAILGWGASNVTGNGVKSMGEALASTRAFSTCQVKKAFKQICFREPANPAERTEVDRIADVFETNGYQMKQVFAEVASFCMGN